MRVAIWRLLVDLVAETFEADGKLVRTLPIFLLQPSRMVVDYVEGKRAAYTSPVRLLVFALAMGFLCMGFGAGRSLDRIADQLEDRPFVVDDGEAVIDQVGREGFAISVEEGSVFEEKLKRLEGMN